MNKYVVMLLAALLSSFVVCAFFAALPESTWTPPYMRGEGFVAGALYGLATILPVIILVMVLSIIRNQYIAFGWRMVGESLCFTTLLSFVLSHAGFNDSHLLMIALPSFLFTTLIVGFWHKKQPFPKHDAAV